MTEIGESVAVIIDAPPSKEDPCWYCEEKPQSDDQEFDTSADFDTNDANSCDDILENDTKNSAAKLAVSLNKVKASSDPVWVVRNPERGGTSRVVPGAHHCIPGGASLAKAKKIIALIKKGVPYSVNHRNNGVWLPGNYAVRPGSEGWTKKWSRYDKDFKDAYADVAMMTAGAQFHDAHPQYNRKVLKALEALEAKLEASDGKCPICQKDYDDKRPPYGLVGRLDAISAAHRAMLTGVAKSNEMMKKSVAAGYYTSSRVQTFFDL